MNGMNGMNGCFVKHPSWHFQQKRPYRDQQIVMEPEIMQTRNKIFEDMSQLMTNAMGVAQGAKDEAENAMKSLVDRWLADRDFVTREEFDAVRLMAQKAREENAALLARVEALETKKKPVAKKPAARKSATKK
jgi:BMFP domain-containing protein YqiC